LNIPAGNIAKHTHKCVTMQCIIKSLNDAMHRYTHKEIFILYISFHSESEHRERVRTRQEKIR
jgi:hypothetical protein